LRQQQNFFFAKLASEQELEVYLITFRKIASLNNWPKKHWSAILQTQLTG